MSYSTEPGRYDGDDRRPSECDTGALDDLKCEAEGISKRADLIKQEAPKLDERRKKYDEARKTYAKARGDAVPQAADLKEQVKQLKDQLECLIKDDRIIRCLKQAHETVQERVKKCGLKTGCCIDDDCEFDTDVHECEPAEMLKELNARQADIKRRTERAESCFDSLIDEPKNLPERIRKWRDELAKIVTEKGGDPKTVDFKRLYARLLVAEWAIYHGLWRGFADVNAYVDCLCRGLMCSLKGRQALATIAAKIAVLECKEREKDAHCKRLQDEIVEEVLAEYLRICPPHPGGEESGSVSSAL